MLKKESLYRPDRQFEKMLINFVYATIALACSVLLLFIFPNFSLPFLVLILILTSLVISIAIIMISDSERVLTYSGFANAVLDNKDMICRIDNADFEPVIENKAASDFFHQKNIFAFLQSHIFENSSGKLSLNRLEEALHELKTENVILELILNKQRRFFEITVKPIYLKKNDIFESDFSVKKIQKETYFFWTLKDITAAQNMECILEAERQKLNYFIQNMPLGLYVLDENGCFEYVNNTFAEHLKCLKTDLIGHSIKDFITKMTESPFCDLKTPEYTGLILFQNKEENIELFVSQNKFQDDGILKIRGLTLNHLPNDQNLLQEIRKITTEYKMLWYYNPVGVLTVTEDGLIKNFNTKAAEILSKDLQGAHLYDFFEESDLKKIEKIYTNYKKNDKQNVLTELETLLKSGKSVLLTITPRYLTYFQKTAFDGLSVFMTDTTKSKNLEERFSQAQKMQALGQFAGGIAHDFNNLLTAMIGYCDLLLERHRIGDPSFADLTEIRRSAIQAAALVKQLLLYSKQQTSNPKYLDVSENLSDLSQFLKRLMGEQITIDIKHTPNLGFIRIDPVHFTQVIMNLSVNAKDAMNGKGTLTISTHLETLLEATPFGDGVAKAGDYIVISVKDTGSGIKKENLSRIFDPFFSTKQNVISSGTGLGLATVYGIVSQTKGLIKVDSTIGVGTTFKIYFPRFLTADSTPYKKETADASQQIPVLTSISGEAPKLVFGLNVNKTDQHGTSVSSTADIKILFVEDENTVRTFGVRALKKKGFNVIPASSAENALEQTGPFDLMVTDMMMPGMSGTELAVEMKKRQPNIKIIIVSGYSEEMAFKELKGDEGFVFLSKPYSLTDLNEKVFEVINS